MKKLINIDGRDRALSPVDFEEYLVLYYHDLDSNIDHLMQKMPPGWWIDDKVVKGARVFYPPVTEERFYVSCASLSFRDRIEMPESPLDIDNLWPDRTMTVFKYDWQDLWKGDKRLEKCIIAEETKCFCGLDHSFEPLLGLDPEHDKFIEDMRKKGEECDRASDYFIDYLAIVKHYQCKNCKTICSYLTISGHANGGFPNDSLDRFIVTTEYDDNRIV